MVVNRIPEERIYIDYCVDKLVIHILDSNKEPYDYAKIQHIQLYITACGFSSKVARKKDS